MTGVKDNIIIQILKYWPVKYLIIVLLGLLVYSGFYHFYRCHNGLNSRFLWGAAECLECKEVKIDSITKHDTAYLLRHDTVKSAIYIPRAPKGEKDNPGVTQNNKGGENNSNSGTNLGNIGGQGNSVTNNFDKQPRHSSPEIISEINSLNPKKLPIEVFYFTNTPEAATFALELIGDLKRQGDSVRDLSVFAMRPDFPKDKEQQYYKNDTMFQLTIWPQLPSSEKVK